MFSDYACLSSMRMFLRLLTSVLGCGLLLTACDSFEKPVLPLGQTDELIVLTVNSPDTHYENAEGNYAGLEFDLVSEFASGLGLKARFKLIPKLDESILPLEKQRAHLAAGLSISAKHSERVHFGPAYQTIHHQVAYNTDHRRPKSIQQLTGRKIEIASGTSHAEALNRIKLQVPRLKWTEEDITPEDLLAKLAEGKIDYAVADSTQINLARNFYPNLAVAFDLGEPTGRAWAFSPHADPALLAKAREFFERIERDGTLMRLLDRYYGHVQRLEPTDVSGILKKRRTVLPNLRSHFYDAEELTAIDWRLIAALAYQESHWNPMAVSPANVRGIMMLTETTADRMNVTDRLDVRQNILAGARYLRALKDRLPPRITEPDRTWMALAAYNQGSSHLEDARILAQRLNLNPDSWLDLKKTLPLLSRSKYFSTVKHGFARGGEAVILTESVRTYYEILQKYERPHAWGLLTHEDRSPSKTESPIATILNFISPGPTPEPEP